MHPFKNRGCNGRGICHGLGAAVGPKWNDVSRTPGYGYGSFRRPFTVTRFDDANGVDVDKSDRLDWDDF